MYFIACMCMQYIWIQKMECMSSEQLQSFCLYLKFVMIDGYQDDEMVLIATSKIGLRQNILLSCCSPRASLSHTFHAIFHDLKQYLNLYWKFSFWH